MTYETIDDLREQFVRGRMKKLPDSITVSGIDYKQFSSSDYSVLDMINGKKAMVSYSLVKSEKNMIEFKKLHKSAEEGIQNRVVFVWMMNRLQLKPLSVKFISKARLFEGDSTEEDTVKIPKASIVGDAVDVVLSYINDDKPIKGKIDTGAELSSLHAENINVTDLEGTADDVVTFDFNGKTYKMTLQDKQAVRSADGGVEYRPVVKLNVTINGTNIPDVLINLNDRSKMPHKLLVGQNILEKGKFLIDPQSNESVDEIDDWDVLQEQFDDVEFANVDVNSQILTQMQQMIDSYKELE